MSKTPPDDQSARAKALDPSQSFIVQAPAGSGKTELLTQRYLSLLTTVSEPEQILCLTFTRKAANEMRERIIQALHSVHQSAPPTETVAYSRWQLAQKALTHAQKRDWDLLKNPNRLRLCTIDAWCHTLVSRMPLLSKLGQQPEIRTDPHPLYEQAATQTIAHVYTQSRWQKPLSTLLTHLDNQHQLAVDLLVAMLAKREQWLTMIVNLSSQADARALCEQTLQAMLLENLRQLENALTGDQIHLLAQCCGFAAQHYPGTENPFTIWQTQPTLPRNRLQGYTHWFSLTELLLTRQNQWRKRVDKSLGFPAPSAAPTTAEKAEYKAYKLQLTQLLESFTDDERLLSYLVQLKSTPPPYYHAEQWAVIEALMQLLPLLVAELQLVFHQSQTVDFNEISLRALQALGDLTQPSDLALSLDQQLQHILVDEFQDTSHGQLHLLRQLTQDWQSLDGRTLFLVGDPMQSIYRFRQAEVGNFLQVQQHGLGTLPLTPLILDKNFRSQAGIVAWINQQFSHILPQQEDTQMGAVPYRPAQATQTAIPNAVQYHHCSDAQSEAQQIITWIKQHTPSDHSIGILVRARSHLQDIAAALQLAELPYQAVELESLAWQPVIQDLWALTQACHHTMDRVAWLSILRAPWCGLDLAALHQLSYRQKKSPLWQRCLDYTEGLDPAAEQRLFAFRQVMLASTQRKQTVPLREWIETTWYELQGHRYCTATERRHAERFFSLLETFDDGGLLTHQIEFQRRLNQLYAEPSNTNSRIHIMTIHKAKGLEFDTVFLPGLHRRGRGDDHRLFYWHSDPEQQQLLVAPIHARHGAPDPIYDFLRGLEQRKDRYEQARILYVAATRARTQLHLLYQLKLSKTGAVSAPSQHSSLGLLWPTLQTALCSVEVQSRPRSIEPTAPTLKRVNTMPPPPKLRPRSTTQPAEQWRDPTPRRVGEYCHQVLHQIAELGLDKWSEHPIANHQARWRQGLRHLGIPKRQLAKALQTVTQVVQNCCADQMGQFILSQHRQAHCEYAIHQQVNGYLKTYIVDRTFISATNTRWVIDYKITAQPDAWVNHQQQVNHYAWLFSQMEPLPIKCALYFPLDKKFESWDFTPQRVKPVTETIDPT